MNDDSVFFRDDLKLLLALLWTQAALLAMRWTPGRQPPSPGATLFEALDLRTSEGRQKAEQALDGIAHLARLAFEKLDQPESPLPRWQM